LGLEKRRQRRYKGGKRKGKKEKKKKRDKERGMLNQREAKGKDDEGPSCLPGLLLLLSFMIFFNTKKCFGFIYLFIFLKNTWAS
jgi:hypothetical protein